MTSAPFLVSFICDKYWSSATPKRKSLVLRYVVLLLTFLAYMSFHLSRKPISVVKPILHKQCNGNLSGNDCGWPPFASSNYSQLEGYLDFVYLIFYAFGMLFTGHLADLMDLRYFLTIGMFSSGLITCAFGFGYFLNIHSYAYYMIIQGICGLVQSTGWPAVVACVANWFGPGSRGLIMGIWTSHTSWGNILGSVIADVWVETAWGWSFIVPGLIIVACGILLFFFLVPHPKMLGLDDPNHIEDDSSNKPLLNDEETGDAMTETKEHAISFKKAFQIPGVLEFSLSLFFAKLVTYTFLYWLPQYIKTSTTYSVEKSGILSTLFDFGGIPGAIFAGFVSDKLRASGVTCGIMLILSVPVILLYSVYGSYDFATNVVILMIMGFFVNGPYSLITTAVSADLGTHPCLKGSTRALSTVSAIIDGTGSIGAALGPLLVGLIPIGKMFLMTAIGNTLSLLFLSRLIYRELLVLRVRFRR